MYVLIVALAGAFLFWLRGSSKFAEWTGRGKTTADAVWAGGLALLTAPFISVWFVIPLAVALWLGGRAPWFGSLSLGRDPTHGSVDVQWLKHAARGILWILPAAILFGFVGTSGDALAFLLVGALCPTWYELGYQIDERWEVLDPTEWGEIFFGFTIGMALAMIVG